MDRLSRQPATLRRTISQGTNKNLPLGNIVVVAGLLQNVDVGIGRAADGTVESVADAGVHATGVEVLEILYYRSISLQNTAYKLDKQTFLASLVLNDE